MTGSREKDKTYSGFEQGPIRPPSEANSILLQVTVGCSRNKCTFCGTYMGERFRIKPDEMEGGTFTVSNGGVFGSMLSTPIVNPPQSAILGMHRIEERPVAENGQVVIRPMMYLALTYDHRIIDGKESVLFLRTIKECLEDPARLLLEL